MNAHRAWLRFSCHLFAAALLFCTRESHACSCASRTQARVLYPADGTSNVGTNTVFRVFLQGFPSRLRSTLDREYRLIDEQGQAFLLRSRLTHTLLELTPLAPLRPNTNYTIEQLFAYNDHFELLSDTERMRSYPSAPSARVWFPSARFRTGAGPSAAHTATISVTATNVALTFDDGDCGPGMDVHVSFSLSPTVQTDDTLQVEVRSRRSPPRIVFVGPVAQRTEVSMGDSSCTLDPIRIPREAGLQVRVNVLDGANRLVGSSPWRPIATPANQRSNAAWEQGRVQRSEQTATEYPQWHSGTILSNAPSAVRSPTACPHGLEVYDLQALPAGQSNNANASLTAIDARAFLALTLQPQEQQTQLYTFSTRSLQPLRAPQEGAVRALFASNDTVFLHSHRIATPETEALSAFTLDGTPRYQRTFPNIDTAGQGAWAVGNNRLLFTYPTRRNNTQQLEWMLFDKATGASIDLPSRPSLPMSAGATPSVVWFQDHFLVAWVTIADNSTIGVVRTITVNQEGVAGLSNTLPVQSDHEAVLAVFGNRVQLATVRNGMIEWSTMDGAGRMQQVPQSLSMGIGDGHNSSPRFAQLQQNLVLAWQSSERREVFATTILPSGVFAPVQRLLAEEGFSGFNLAHGNQEQLFIAFQRANRPGSLGALRCRSTPSALPPQRIAPPNS